jgi:hypothetical protein
MFRIESWGGGAARCCSSVGGASYSDTLEGGAGVVWVGESLSCGFGSMGVGGISVMVEWSLGIWGYEFVKDWRDVVQVRKSCVYLLYIQSLQIKVW